MSDDNAVERMLKQSAMYRGTRNSWNEECMKAAIKERIINEKRR